MQVRPADPSDIDLLASVWYDGWQDAHAEILPLDLAARRTLDSFRQRLRAALPNVQVVGSPAPVGFCLIRGDELCQLYVSAGARGSGAAADLLADAESRMRDAGVETAWLACAVGNERAARFYQKHGWVRAGTVMHEPDDSGGSRSKSGAMRNAYGSSSFGGVAAEGLRSSEPAFTLAVLPDPIRPRHD